MRAIFSAAVLCIAALPAYAGSGGPAHPCDVTVDGISFVIDLTDQPHKLKDGTIVGFYCAPDQLAQLYPSGSVVQVISATQVDGHPSPVNGVYRVSSLAECYTVASVARCRDVLNQPHELTTDQLAVIQAAIAGGQRQISIP